MKKMRILVGDENQSVSKKDRQFIDRLKARRKEILASVADILREGIDSGEFRNVDVGCAVTFLEAVIWGYCHVRFWRDKEYSVQKAADFIHDFMLQGLEKRDDSAKGD